MERREILDYSTRYRICPNCVEPTTKHTAILVAMIDEQTGTEVSRHLELTCTQCQSFRDEQIGGAA